MSLLSPKRLLGALLVATAVVIGSAAPHANVARAEARTVQVADILNLDIFRRRGFPIATCEVRCQEARTRCENRARNADDRRDCRLEYSVCSNDCNVYESR